MLRLNTPKTNRAMLLWTTACLSGLLLIFTIAPVLRGQDQPGSGRIPFTEAQSEAGGRVYAQRCASCHGTRLDDGVAPPLAGQKFFDTWASTNRSLDDLHFIIRSTMPKNEAGTLSAADYNAVLAYILGRNGYPAGDRELTPDQNVLAALRLSPPGSATPDKKEAPAYVAGTGGTSPKATGPTHQDLLAAGRGRDWLMHEHDYSGTRYSPLTQITTANASRLRVACVYQVGETGNFQTGPVVDRGTMYVTSTYATIAIDAANCRPKWRHVWTALGADRPFNNRGVAIRDGRVIRASSDGYLYALDAQDGRLLWARRIGDTTKGETFTMAPLVFDNLILIGPGISEFGIKAWFGAFRLDTGEQVWRFNIVPSPGEPGYETWQQPAGFPVGGGGVWGAPTLDPEREMIYVATGNPAPDFPAAMRGGVNLYTNSVLALNVRTGKLAWYQQQVPADSHDWDLTHASPIYTATINGRERKLLGSVGKDGVLRVVDRDSQAPVFDTPVTTLENIEARVTPAGTHACPGLVGGVEWNGPSFHPGLGLIVVPAVDWCATFYMDPNPRFVPGQVFLGGRTVNDAQARGWITAIDGATGKVRWKYQSSRPVVGAVTTTAGGLVLAGELTGDFVAFDAASGDVRYRFNTGGPIGGGIVTYETGGQQYVAVASGRMSRMWAQEHAGSPVVLVFALDNAAR